MSKKLTVVLITALVVLIAWGIGVYQVNKGVARDYDIKTYQMGDKIPIDNAVLKVTKVSQGEVKAENGIKSFPVSVDMQIQNITKENIAIIGIIETKLAYGLVDYQGEGEYDVGKMRNLPPNETTTITITFTVNPKEKGKKAKLYFDQRLYEQQVNDKYQDGKRYGISVNLPKSK